MGLLLEAALLGVVQGLTEFLPVSSSAHLILARAFFGWNAEQFGLPFDVACHVGTLSAIVIYFQRDLRDLLSGVPHIFAKSEHDAYFMVGYLHAQDRLFQMDSSRRQASAGAPSAAARP